MSVAVTATPAIRVSRPSRLLQAAPDIVQYVPGTSADRFLLLLEAKGEKLPSTKVVLNWQAVLR